jgi:hypothetical protein
MLAMVALLKRPRLGQASLGSLRFRHTGTTSRYRKPRFRRREAVVWWRYCDGSRGIMRALNQHYVSELNLQGNEPHWGRRKLKRDQRPSSFTGKPLNWLATSITSHQGLLTLDAAEAWFEENDPEGVAFEYDLMGLPAQLA